MRATAVLTMSRALPHWLPREVWPFETKQMTTTKWAMRAILGDMYA
jgi:hypothetical protein